ncbi:hypothetical protein D9M70_571430 [compost metagenome]
MDVHERGCRITGVKQVRRCLSRGVYRDAIVAAVTSRCDWRSRGRMQAWHLPESRAIGPTGQLHAGPIRFPGGTDSAPPQALAPRANLDLPPEIFSAE